MELELERPQAQNGSVVFDLFQAFPAMVDFTVLILPGAYASSVALTLDILATAAAMADRVGSATPRWRVFAAAANPPTPLAHGLRIEARPLPASPRDRGSTWVLPGLGIDDPAALAERLAQPDARQAISVLRAQVRSGATVAASCSSVFLLQQAGLLEGRKATTSWWLAARPAWLTGLLGVYRRLAARLQAMEPRCRVEAERMVVADGPVVTAGAALAQTDLMLHLLRTRFGPRLAEAVSRVLLIDARQAQAPFIAPTLLSSGNALIARLTARIEAALPAVPSVAALAAECGMSERTLARHVRAATGRSTLALLQSIRAGQARRLLENSRLTVEQVAERVGYADTTALRRLMRKVAGATPSHFRPAVFAAS